MATTNVGSVSMDLVLNKRNFDKEVKSSALGTQNAFSTSMKKIGGYIATAFSIAAITKFSKSSIDAASQMQSAWTGLKSIADGTGNSFSAAQKFINEYTKDGLVSVNEAVTSYKNLLSRGYDTTQIENTMTALKDSASFGRQASYDLGEAVVTATEGLKNENSILVDNAGVTKNVAKMWEDWAKAHNTTTAAMTQAQKIEAEYNGILEETRFQAGDAATYTKTFGGQVQGLKMAFNNLKVAVGQVIIPIANLFIPIINAALVAITNFFNGIKNLLSLFGLSFPSVVSKTSAGIESVGKSATDTASDIASTGSAAKKAAKQIQKAFAPIDEITTINTKSNSSSSSEDNLSSIPNTTSTANLDSSPITNEFNKTNGVIDEVINKFKELQKLFSVGFNIGFKGTSFDGIFESINNIKKSLQNIFTDSKVLNASNNWVNTVTTNLGKIIGSIAQIGTNIIDGLIGSINTYLTENTEIIKTHLINMFNISSEDIDIKGRLLESLGSISEIFTSDTAKKIGSDLIEMFANPIMSITELLSKFGRDMLDLIVTPISDNVDKIKKTIEGILEPVQTVTGTISDAFTHVGDSINKVYDEHMKPFFDSLKNGLSDTFSKFLDVYNQYFKPFVDETAKNIKNLWEQHLKPLWDNISEFIGVVIDHIKLVWEKWLKPLIDWCIQNILPKIVPILNTIKDVVFTVIGTITDVISGIIKMCTGIIQFIDGVFSGDWDKAWTGIKNIFKGIIDGLVSVFKLPFNLIIDGINGFLNGLNQIKIPDWVPFVGGKGFNIKPIQHLANGKYVERNNPQLAIIGDNTREGEIVTPESKIYDQVKRALNERNNVTNKQELAITIYHKYEDGKTIIQKVNQAQIDAGEILLMT